jgi:tetratricopeptide (TPR) repeat protein
MGVALAKSGRTDEAIEHFEAAALLAVRNPSEVFTAYANLARAYSQANRPQDAEANAHKAIQLARSQNQPALAAQVEAWLEQVRAERVRTDTAPASR